MFRSLRVRIALSHALVLLVILVALGVTLQYVLARTLDASVTRQLRASADGDMTLRLARQLIQEGLRQHRLADARLSANANHGTALTNCRSEAVI